MEQNHSFRTAGFGGFHRQDVLDYIKETAERHKDQIEELQKSLKKAVRRRRPGLPWNSS